MDEFGFCRKRQQIKQARFSQQRASEGALTSIGGCAKTQKATSACGGGFSKF
jgi:hypothetical protein